MTKNNTVPHLRVALVKTSLPCFPQFPRIPCYNNWVVIHAIRCQGCARPPTDSCFWGICHVRHPRPQPQADGKTMAVFVSPPTFHQQGGWGDSVSVSDRKCSLSSFTSVPASDVFGVAQRKQCCLLLKTETGWVSLPVFPSPDRWSPVLTHKCCFIRLQSLSSLHLLILVNLLFTLRKMTPCIITAGPLCLTLSLQLSLLAGKQFYTVRQTPHAQNTQTLVVLKSCAEIQRVQTDWKHTDWVELP